jgi:hypothetical protein
MAWLVRWGRSRGGAEDVSALIPVAESIPTGAAFSDLRESVEWSREEVAWVLCVEPSVLRAVEQGGSTFVPEQFPAIRGDRLMPLRRFVGVVQAFLAGRPNPAPLPIVPEGASRFPSSHPAPPLGTAHSGVIPAAGG